MPAVDKAVTAINGGDEDGGDVGATREASRGNESSRVALEA